MERTRARSRSPSPISNQGYGKVDSPGEQHMRRELAGFLLPGMLHEFRNLLNRINLLTELPIELGPLPEIRQEIHSPDFAFLCDLMRSLASSGEERASAHPAHGGREAIWTPQYLDGLLRVLRSSARKVDVTLRVEDMSSVNLDGTGIGESSELCQAVYGFCARSVPPKELTVSAGTDSWTGGAAILVISESGETVAVAIGAKKNPAQSAG